MAAAATRGDRRTIYDDATHVKTLLQQRVSGVVTPHNARDALFVVIFHYVVVIGQFEVMRMILQRGSVQRVARRFDRRGCESESTSQNREAEAEAETQNNDGIATELSVSQIYN